jgi:hypothetical protein
MSDNWNPDSLFLRQVNPHHWDGSRPNSQAFVPYPKDEDKVSVDDGAMVTPEDAWWHFTERLGFDSVGTWAVSHGEVIAAGDLTVSRSPVTGESDPARNNPAHCHIDFSKVSSKGQKRKRAQTLAIRAAERGCLFSAVK